MDSKRILRNAIIGLVGRKQGTSYFLSRTGAAQRRSDSITVDLMTLPEMRTTALQNWDPDDPDYTLGEFFHMADFDPVPDSL